MPAGIVPIHRDPAEIVDSLYKMTQAHPKQPRAFSVGTIGYALAQEMRPRICGGGRTTGCRGSLLRQVISGGNPKTMSTKKTGFFKSGMLAAAMLAMFAFGSSASASVVRIHFSGAVGSGHADLTLGGTNPADVVDPGKLPLTIVDANGVFNGVTITGVRALDPTTAPGEVLPYSYSLFSIPGYGDHDGISYDNLLYPGGSPLICLINGTPVYPFSGGFLDLMGVMFTLDDGSFVDLWSFGDTAPGFFGPSWPGGLTYGMSLIQPDASGGYTVVGAPPFASASVPEPDFLWLFGAAVLGLLTWRRRAEKKV